MFNIPIFSLLITSFLASSGTPKGSVKVSVLGVGLTEDEAKKAGCREAIQQVFATLNLPDKKVINIKLFEDDVAHVKGVISSYKVISKTINSHDKKFSLAMVVTVSPSSIQKRLFYSGSSPLKQND